MVWTVLLFIWYAGALLFLLLGLYMIWRGKSGIDLIVVGVFWPLLLLAAVLGLGGQRG